MNDLRDAKNFVSPKIKISIQVHINTDEWAMVMIKAPIESWGSPVRKSNFWSPETLWISRTIYHLGLSLFYLIVLPQIDTAVEEMIDWA